MIELCDFVDAYILKELSKNYLDMAIAPNQEFRALNSSEGVTKTCFIKKLIYTIFIYNQPIKQVKSI